QAYWHPSSMGSLIGGPMGGLIPCGGGAIIPGGGTARPTGVVGGPAMLAVAAAATIPLPCGVMTCWDGPPWPHGQGQLIQQVWGIGTPAGTPLPAAPPAPSVTSKWYLSNASTFTGYFLHCHGNQVLPGSHTRPQTCFSSYSECSEFFALIFLNSSQSQRIEFTYLSKPLKGPMKIQPSCRTYLAILILL
uniref:Uncharacterized protein n=1 Tax=Capra hircus TaxID=9925 RepID=A0A8C2SEN8_CAPHI